MTGSITPREIQKIVASHFKMRAATLHGPDRHRKIAVPRMMAMALCREHTKASLTAIGRAFNRDHTTVWHGLRALATNYNTPENEQHMIELRAKIYGQDGWLNAFKSEVGACTAVGLFLRDLGEGE